MKAKLTFVLGLLVVVAVFCTQEALAVQADLTATKTNNVSGTTQGTFNWTVQVFNQGSGDANFTIGQTLLTDDLPSSGATYGTPSVSPSGGVSGTGSISCSISSNTLTCTASG